MTQPLILSKNTVKQLSKAILVRLDKEIIANRELSIETMELLQDFVLEVKKRVVVLS